MVNKQALVKIIGSVFIFFLSAISYTKGQTIADIDTILNRYRLDLIQNDTSFDSVDHLINTIKEVENTGYDDWKIWPDIDYRNSQPAKWDILRHLDRVRKLILAWSNPDSKWYHQNLLWDDIQPALDYWIFHRFYNPNWYHNEISVPQRMQDILILAGPHLSRHEYLRCLEEMDQFRFNGTGSNLILSGKLGFYYGAITKDTALMNHSMKIIQHEIKINPWKEGIQPDWSFHMHLSRLQIYSYGKAYLGSVLQLAVQCRNTPWAFTGEKVSTISDFVLNGWQWMARGRFTVPGTVDRAISNRGALTLADIRKWIPELKTLNPQRSELFDSLKNRQDGVGKPLKGFRYFPYSDFAAYHNEHYTFFLKLISQRTLPTESINGDNLKGALLNSGDGYLIRNGEEYTDLMPSWNWDKLPGITSFEGADKIDRRCFVGSVSDGESGLSAMDYLMVGKDTTQKMAAHKIWACHKGVVVALIAGLRVENINKTVYTVLDQSRKNGDIYVNGHPMNENKGTEELGGVDWIYHNGFSYIPISTKDIRLKFGKVEGEWSSVSGSAHRGLPVLDSVFLPLLIHKKSTQYQNSGYVLAYSTSPQTALQLVKKPKWKVIRNDDSVQAVRFDDHLVMAAFFSPQTLIVSKKQKIQVDRPCLLIISEGEIRISDPSQRGGKINVTVNKRRFTLDLPHDGTSLSQKISDK